MARGEDIKGNIKVFNLWRKTFREAGLSFLFENGCSWIYNHFIFEYYSESHRLYHTLDHIVDCLNEFDRYKKDTASQGTFFVCPEEIELAIWLHDLIYDPKSSGNERRSCDMARLILKVCGVSDKATRRVCKMIRLTDRHSKDLDFISIDQQVFMDIDCSILGRDYESFQDYDEDIRSEYGFVPDKLFKEKRKDFLKEMIKRKSIFYTTYFKDKYENQARTNILAILKEKYNG